MSKELQIRNRIVDFLAFTRDAGEDGIVVRVQNGDVWLTQKAISQLFDVDRSVVTKHLSNIFKEGELDENSICAKFAQTADDGKTYNYKFYSLAAIIAVGYRINSVNDAEVLQDKGKVTAAIAKEFAESEFEKYRVIQDSLYESDFDKLMNDMEKNDAIHQYLKISSCRNIVRRLQFSQVDLQTIRLLFSEQQTNLQATGITYNNDNIAVVLDWY